jgi:hypothetical protein
MKNIKNALLLLSVLICLPLIGAEAPPSPISDEQALFNAVLQKNPELVKKMLATKKVDLNWQKPRDYSNFSLTDLFNDPNNSGNFHETALTLSIKTNQDEITKLLLAAGSDPNLTLSSSLSAFHYAALYNNPYEIVDLLIKAGANPNLNDVCGNTPYILFAIRGRKDVLDLLLKAGADAAHRNNEGYTAQDILTGKARREWQHQRKANEGPQFNFVPAENRPVFEPSVYEKVTGSPATNATAYRILGVPVGATQEQIKHAYKQKTLLWHPDKNPDPQAGQAFALITWAYDQLK